MRCCAVTPKISQLWNDYFDNLGFDVILVPTTPITARPIGAAEPYSEINGRLEPTLQVYARTAEIDCPSSVPGLSVPIGLAADGLPIGIQLHSRPGVALLSPCQASVTPTVERWHGMPHTRSQLHCPFGET